MKKEFTILIILILLCGYILFQNKKITELEFKVQGINQNSHKVQIQCKE